MAYRQEKDTVRTVCYPSGSTFLRRILGIALIVLGVIIILWCIPFWAWWGLIGAALILLGLWLAKGS